MIFSSQVKCLHSLRYHEFCVLAVVGVVGIFIKQADVMLFWVGWYGGELFSLDYTNIVNFGGMCVFVIQNNALMVGDLWIGFLTLLF